MLINTGRTPEEAVLNSTLIWHGTHSILKPAPAPELPNPIRRFLVKSIPPQTMAGDRSMDKAAAARIQSAAVSPPFLPLGTPFNYRVYTDISLHVM